jgi:hypothetical protein
VYDPKFAVQPNEVVPIGGHPGGDLVQAQHPTLDSLLATLAELEPKPNLTVHTIHFCAETTVAQEASPI